MSPNVSRRITQIVAIALVFAFVKTSAAQTDSNSKIITREGSAAAILSLQGLGSFGLAGPGNPFSFGVGAKYYLSDGLALRGMLNFSSTSGSLQNPESASAKPMTTIYGIGIGLEKHCPQPWNVSPYWGGQVGFGHVSWDDGLGTPTSTITGSIFSAQVIAGFDYFPWRGIAVGGEAALGFQSITGFQTRMVFSQTEGPTGPTQTETTISLGTGSNIHLLVYF